MNKSLALLCLICLMGPICKAQLWVDSLYAVQDFLDVPYGSATDFAGNERTLVMDITVPVGDVVPTCGRPFMLLIHGGAFLAGTKTDPAIAAMRRDFAERGYVTASINYRLGMFQPSSEIHCNVTYIPGVEWDCLNQTDTLEWGRGLFRGVQDAHGALRYMVNHAATYEIDPNNVFVVGESAGGFIAMGLGYMDDPVEYPTGVGAVSAAPAPFVPTYEGRCVQFYGWDTSVASMQLLRPDLGDVEGTLNPTSMPYTIRGVGNFYGAMLKDYLQVNSSPVMPALYLYHQPNDLIVPYSTNKVLAGYAYCMTFVGCAYIVNRPMVMGSESIRDLIEARMAGGLDAPDYLFDSTLNNADCAAQIADNSKTGHAIDNYNLRTGKMATFFASHIAGPTTPCFVSTESPQAYASVKVFPNPSSGALTVQSDKNSIAQVRILAPDGRLVFSQLHDQPGNQLTLHLPSLPDGLYLMEVRLRNGASVMQTVVLQK